MNATELKARISEFATHILFSYNSKECGIDPLSATEIDVWYGDCSMTAESVDEVMSTAFFDGKTLTEICEEVKFVVE